MKKVLIINGHPQKESFNGALVEAYKKGAVEAGAEVREIHVGEMPLENYLRYEHFKGAPVGQDITDAQNDIAWADHIVFVHPVWWGGMPAILKCFVDMVFAPGFAFRYRKISPIPEKLLKGRTARIIVTMDTPVLIHRHLFGAPGINQLKDRTLAFCGIAPTKVTYLSPIRKSTPESRDGYLRLKETFELLLSPFSFQYF